MRLIYMYKYVPSGKKIIHHLEKICPRRRNVPAQTAIRAFPGTTEPHTNK